MLLATILYNLILGVALVAGLAWVAHKPTPGTWTRVCVWGAMLALLIALMMAMGLGMSRFAAVRLAAYGLFGHGVVFLLAAAWLLRRRCRRTAVVSLAVALLTMGVAVDAFLIEPTWLEVTHHEIALTGIRRPVRVVVLADLQTDRIGPYERDAIARAMAEKPDLLLFAGDYLQAEPSERPRLAGELNASLADLDVTAPMGVFAVRGNYEDDDWAEIFHGLPIVSVEQTTTFDLGDLRLTCLSARASFNDRATLDVASDDRPHLVLGHSPNYALSVRDADLMVAGHTHGGQIRIPGLGPVVTLSAVPRAWAAALTEIDDGRWLLVSRGIGMERGTAPRIRFCCRPELAVLDLVPEPSP